MRGRRPWGLSLQYDREADWHLLNTCNYRCTYCFFDDRILGSKLKRFAHHDEWRDAFDATGDTWLLHLTGGEPSVYPGFVELCEALTTRHYISLNTNLTNASFVPFAERIAPARVSFINAGLHLEERERRKGQGVFLRHARLLREKGFPLLISLVATPEALARYDEVAEWVAPTGLVPIPKLVRGRHDGRMYPNDYSADERARFRALAARAREVYAPVLARMDARPSIDMFNDDRFLGRLPSFTGRACDAGDRFVSIKKNGDVYRCGPKVKLGNILHRTFAPMAGGAACDTRYCFYFCTKYARPKADAVVVAAAE